MFCSVYKGTLNIFILALFSIAQLSFGDSPQVICELQARSMLPAGIHHLLDSLKANEFQKYRFTRYSGDSFSIADSVNIRSLPGDSENGVEYFPRYLQYSGDYSHFIDYILVFDPSLDSVVTCDKKVRLYFSDRCDFCDSGFWSGTANLSTQFHYYRFQEIYGSFFSFRDINEVQVFVGNQNRTYLPFASDLPVFAPGKSMKKKWFARDVDYARFFPVDFPATLNSDIFMDDNGDFTWSENAANRWFSIPVKTGSDKK